MDITRKEAILIVQGYIDRLKDSASNQLDKDIQALTMARNSLEIDEKYQLMYEGDAITHCEDCANFIAKDRYCKVLNINWMPDNFECNRGIKRERRN